MEWILKINVYKVKYFISINFAFSKTKSLLFCQRENIILIGIMLYTSRYMGKFGTGQMPQS